MAASVEPLVAAKVIGDVIDHFTPAADLTVIYGNQTVTNGCELKPSEAKEKPHVKILSHNPKPDNLYTLLMVDPDAPSPTEPTLREWLHWLVVDIPEGKDASKGQEIVQYMGPSPPKGKHRYVLIVFKQLGPLVKPRPVPAPDARAEFSTRRFTQHNNLGSPVAALYFYSQKEGDIAYVV